MVRRSPRLLQPRTVSSPVDPVSFFSDSLCLLCLGGLRLANAKVDLRLVTRRSVAPLRPSWTDLLHAVMSDSSASCLPHYTIFIRDYLGKLLTIQVTREGLAQFDGVESAIELGYSFTRQQTSMSRDQLKQSKMSTNKNSFNSIGGNADKLVLANYDSVALLCIL